MSDETYYAGNGNYGYDDSQTWPMSASMARDFSHESGSSYSNYSMGTTETSPGTYMERTPSDGNYHQPESSTNNYIVSGQGGEGGDGWYQYYDFKTTGDNGPFWQLKKGFSPSAEYPATVPAVNNDDDRRTPRSAADGHVCLFPNCLANPFRRKADLERHIKMTHQTADQKESFHCDWKKCQRSRDAFFRRDHYRDHLRDYHNEDLERRGGNKESREWWKSRNFEMKRWRCTRCLQRIDIDTHGFECTSCKLTCGTERRKLRGFK